MKRKFTAKPLRTQRKSLTSGILGGEFIHDMTPFNFKVGGNILEDGKKA
jgi:hypothetical protein